MLEAVTQPVLIMHVRCHPSISFAALILILLQGDKNTLHPVKYAHDLASKLRNAKDGARVYVMKGRLLSSLLTPTPHLTRSNDMPPKAARDTSASFLAQHR